MLGRLRAACRVARVPPPPRRRCRRRCCLARPTRCSCRRGCPTSAADAAPGPPRAGRRERKTASTLCVRAAGCLPVAYRCLIGIRKMLGACDVTATACTSPQGRWPQKKLGQLGHSCCSASSAPVVFPPATRPRLPAAQLAMALTDSLGSLGKRWQNPAVRKADLVSRGKLGSCPGTACLSRRTGRSGLGH